MLQLYLSFPPVVSFRFVDSTEIMAANDFFRYLLLHPASVAPDNKSEGGAGFDLHAVLWSAFGQEVVIPPSVYRYGRRGHVAEWNVWPRGAEIRFPT